MGKIINSYIFPHPPIIVPGIGMGREKAAIATIEACKTVAREIAKDSPTTIIISTPHAPSFRDFIVISDSESLAGDFGDFGQMEISMDFENNLLLASEIIENALAKDINAGFLSEHDKRQYQISDRLDHGAMVPLYFVKQEFEKINHKCKVIHLSTPFLKNKELYEFGKCIQKSVLASDEKVVYIASGDLSHRLTKDAPAGYNPIGKVYDAAMVEIVLHAKVDEILAITDQEMEDAGECGTRSFVIMFGALSGYGIRPFVYSYEGPFGVGYLVAKIEITNRNINK